MAYYKRPVSNGPSAEDKAMDKFTELIIDRIKEIQTDWQKPWLCPGSQRWPVNLDGRRYCSTNALVLMFQAGKEEYDVPVWATFNRIIGLNYKTDKEGNKTQVLDSDGKPRPTVCVQKGEKSMPVFLMTFTVINKETKEKIPYEEYRKLDREEQQKYNVYPKNQVFNVFNVVAQTNVKEARPELYEKLMAQAQGATHQKEDGEQFHLPVYDEMMKKQLWFCPVELTHEDNCYYSVSKDKVWLPFPKYFKDGESFIGALNHECIHSLGSADRLNRLKAGAVFGSSDYAREELCAELGAALVCSRMGITKNLKNDSAAYLKSWLEHLEKEPEFLKTVLSDVKKAVWMMTGRLDHIQQQIDDYQKIPGNERSFPDLYDLDGDSEISDLAHVQKEFEMSDEPAPFKSRGRR